MIKKCAFCGKEVETLDSYEKEECFDKMGRPKKNGGSRDYFNLWKRIYDICPYCYYSSLDVSKISKKAKEFMLSENFRKIKNNKIFLEISEFRQTNILPFVVAGYLFEKEESYFESACAFMNASDEFYGEIIYWEGESEEDGNLQGKDVEMDKNFYLYADKLYEKSIKMLDKYLKNNKDDMNARLLYIGFLSGGEEKQKEKSKELIKNLPLEMLSKKQIEIVNFINKTTY